MSSFFADQDNITFGIQGSNVAEIAQWSSTLDDVMFRFFTNNNAPTDNFVTGTVIGSSNYDKTAAARNDLYFGHVSDYSNVERILTIRENRVGINTAEPMATLDIVGSNLGGNDLTRITLVNAQGQTIPSLNINSAGEVGIGTTAVSGTALSVQGKLVVSELEVLGGSSTTSLLTAGGLQPPSGLSFLEFNDASFCNISSIIMKGSLTADSNIVASNILLATNIQPVLGDTVQFTNATLSNIANIVVNNSGTLSVDNINGSSTADLINFTNSTLSNVNTLIVQNLTTGAANGTINVTQKSLSNLAFVKTDSLQTANLYGAPGTNVINAMDTTLSNVGDVDLASGSVLRANTITDAGNSFINFNNTTLTNINDLNVNGDIKVRGEFFVMQTTTCNTNQFTIENDSTGPALIVNQKGYQHIAQFMDDSNVVMFIKDGGQTAFGSFGNAINTSIPSSLVYVENPATSNQTAVYVDQQNAGENRLMLAGPSDNVVVDGSGRLGMGVNTPTARIHTAISAGTNDEFIRMSSNNDPSFIVTSGAQVGIGTDPTNTDASLFVKGRIQNTTDVRTFGVVAPSGTDLYFGMNTLSNINVVKAAQTQATSSGTATAPAYTFESDTNTGIFLASSDQLAFATNGAEAYRVDGQGNVGFGTQVAPVSVYINKTDSLRIPVGTNAQRPAAPQEGYIRYNNETSQFEGFGTNAWGSLGGVKDVNQDTYISAENAPNENNDELKFFTSNVQRMYIANSEGQGNVGIGTTIARTRLDIDSGTLRADRVQINKLSSTGSVIDSDQKTLSNINVTKTTNLEVTNVTTIASGGLINVQNNSLSNITTLSKVGTVDVSKLTNTMNNNVIDATFQTLSNINFTKTENLEVTNVTTTAAGGLINVQNNSLSNISTMSKVGTVDVSKLTNTMNNNVIDATFQTLSNINFTKTQNLEVTNVTTTSAGGLINVQNNTLSNITTLSKVGTIDVAKLTNTLDDTIDVSFETLSNINFTKTQNLEVTNVTTTAAGSLINVQGNSLSNITTMSKVTTIDVSKLTNTMNNNVIDATFQTLSNINFTKTQNLEVTNITTTDAAGLINVQGNSLSNITTLSKVDTIDVKKLTNTLGDTIDVTFETLSNINFTKTENLEVTNITTTAAGGLINMKNNSLSNIANLSKVTTIDVSKLTNTMNNNVIDATFQTLSNINFTKTENLEVTNMTTTTAAGLINVQNNSLSNITVLSKVGTIDVSKLTVTDGTDNINVDNKSLSNVSSLVATNVRTSTLMGPVSMNVIDVSHTTLSNIEDIHIVNGSKLHTNDITSVDGATTINFNNQNVNNINNLWVNGDIRVRGEFFVFDTTTCNTNQLYIDNDNTGPALMVNQRGTENIAHFMDDSNVVMFIKDGGQTAFGSFGNTVNVNNLPSTLVYIENPSTSNQTGLYVKQENTAEKILHLDGGVNSVVVDGTGHLGMGVVNPQARIDVLSTDSLPFMQYSNVNHPSSTIQISQSGRVGIATNASSAAELYVNGTTQTNVLVTSSITTPSGNSIIDMNNNTLSNINGFLVNQIASTNFNVENLSGVGVDKNINVTQSSLSNINVTSTNKLFVDEIAPLTTDAINVMTKSLSNLSYVKTTNLEVSKVTSLVNTIDMSTLSLSNMTYAKTTNLEVSKVTSLLSTVDMSALSLSNLTFVKSGSVEVSTITSVDPNINVSGRTLSNVGDVLATGIVTPNITGTGANKEVSMNYSRVLDIDNLVVRSNITVTMTGLNTYTNLPIDLVRIDQASGKILDQYISSNIVRLMQNGQINPALIPVVDSGRNTLLHTKDRVGIGLRNPQQKLHVNGNQIITSGRLGIGTTTPLHGFHMVDDNSAISSFCVETVGSTDIMRVSGSNSTPVFFITANCNVGISTSAPLYNLHVNGTAYATNAVRTNAFDSDTGTINCRSTSLSNIFTAHMENLVVNGSITIPSVVSANSASDTIEVNTISAHTSPNISVTSALHVSGYNTSLYSTYDGLYGDNTNYTRIGIKVDNSVLARTLLTISDRRTKTNIVESDKDTDLDVLLNIPVQRFSFVDTPNDPEIVGFVAQEVEAVAPYAVRTTSGPVPTIMKDVEVIDEHTLRFDCNTVSAYQFTVGTVLKVLIGENELLVRIKGFRGKLVEVEEKLPEVATVFVYGPVVSDFKLLDSERLVPIVFNAVKKMHKTQQDLQTRIARLEAALGLNAL